MKKKKINRKIIYIIAAAFLILMFLIPSGDKNVTRLKRPAYGQEDKSYKLHVKKGDSEFDMEVPVSAVEIPEDRLQNAFSEAYEAVCRALPGENKSLYDVKEKLNFISTYDKYGMTVSYEMDRYDIVDGDGNVNNENLPENGEDVKIYARIEYKELSQTYEIPVHIMPEKHSEQEITEQKIIDSMNKGSPDTDEYVRLPDKIDETEVTFISKGKSKVMVILMTGVILFCLWYYKKIIIPQNKRDQRELQMKSDYSEIVSKLSLLMGAGMSGANAFARIAADYRDTVKDKNSPKARYAYEEIVTASGQIASGMSESKVYADFGKRCRIHSYVKLAGLMAQNVRKGGDGFTAMLRAETTEAFEERKALARQKGEKAGTKLLIPMIMMLAVVLVMIMVPAFMSFG